MSYEPAVQGYAHTAHSLGSVESACVHTDRGARKKKAKKKANALHLPILVSVTVGVIRVCTD